MSFMDSISTCLTSQTSSLKTHAPEILRGIGYFLGASSLVAAIKGTVDAVPLVDDYYVANKKPNEKMSVGEMIKVTWKCYVPMILCAGGATASFVMADREFAKRGAAVAAACKIAEETLDEYRHSVAKRIGPSEESKLHDEAVEKSTEKTEKVIIVPTDNVPCYDMYTKQCFTNSMSGIKESIIKLNHSMQGCMTKSLSDYCYELGIPVTKMCDDLGWSYDKELIEVRFGSILIDKVPRLAVSLVNEPRKDYDK